MRVAVLLSSLLGPSAMRSLTSCAPSTQRSPVRGALPCAGPMRRRFRPIAAHCHAAPAPCVALAHIQEPQGAGGAFASSHKGEVLLADEVANRHRDRQQ
jgi:hypothetical protein